jgi:hypothetical protein
MLSTFQLIAFAFYTVHVECGFVEIILSIFHERELYVNVARSFAIPCHAYDK